MAIKYIHARMPGRELIHLVPAVDLIHDDHFGDAEEFVTGYAQTLCGRTNTGWVIGLGGDPCERCAAKRHAASRLR